MLLLRNITTQLKVTISRRPRLRTFNTPRTHKRKLTTNGRNQVTNHTQATQILQINPQTNLQTNLMHHLRATIKATSHSMLPLTPTNRLMGRMQHGRSNMDNHPISQASTAQSTDYPTMRIPHRILTPHQLRPLFISIQLILFHRLTNPPAPSVREVQARSRSCSLPGTIGILTLMVLYGLRVMSLSTRL
jgi:hypothetical protein